MGIIRIGPLGSTVEVMVDQGESIALRSSEWKSLNCEIIVIPLSAVNFGVGKYYRIKNLQGGISFKKEGNNFGYFKKESAY